MAAENLFVDSVSRRVLFEPFADADADADGRLTAWELSGVRVPCFECLPSSSATYYVTLTELLRIRVHSILTSP